LDKSAKEKSHTEKIIPCRVKPDGGETWGSIKEPANRGGLGAVKGGTDLKGARSGYCFVLPKRKKADGSRGLGTGVALEKGCEEGIRGSGKKKVQCLEVGKKISRASSPRVEGCWGGDAGQRPICCALAALLKERVSRKQTT